MPDDLLGPLVDHHCHGLDTGQLDRLAFEGSINEATGPAPRSTTVFDSMLGLAVRRWCAPVLDLEPHADPADYLDRRRELGGREVARRFLVRAGITDFLVDTGLAPGQVCSPGDLAALTGGTAHEVVRLEQVAEQILEEGGPDGFADRVEERLRGSGAVAAKSIAAYRAGLELPTAAPHAAELRSALTRVVDAGGGRLADPVVSGWLAWTALRLGMPLQLHVGFGDSDLDLRTADPRLLTGFLRATEPLGVPVLLLHNYPYHREAAYLAHVFSHVFVDVGLAIHNTGALSRAVVAETLEVVPFGKLLFSTDAYVLAEMFWLGAHLFRRAWGAVMDNLIAHDELTTLEAQRISRLVARENAHRVYRLDA